MASAGQSLPGGSVCCTPTRDGVRERKGRAGTHQCWVSWSTSPGPPCLLWQIHRCRNPGAPAPQGLHASSSLALHPEKAEAGGWGGRLGAVGRAQQSGVRAGNTKLKSPSLAVSTWGLGLPPDAQASYFFPVRWMCWKRVMEKAMPRICMIRTHIPTMPSTCLLSSNHIFTFS